MKTIKKGILNLAMAACLSIGLSVSASAAELKGFEEVIPADTAVSTLPEEHNVPFTALTPAAAEVAVALNGEVMEMKNPAHALDGTTFVSVESMVRALHPEAATVCTGDDMELTGPDVSVRIRVGEDAMEVNGDVVELGHKSVVMDEEVMVPLRPLCEALGAEVSWDAENGMVNVETQETEDAEIDHVLKDKGISLNSYSGSGAGGIFRGGSKVVVHNQSSSVGRLVGGPSYGGMGGGAYVSAGGSYSEEDVYWLSRIIEAESGNQSMEGKIGVGNVIMNRVESSAFPNSVEGVVFQDNQFTTAADGSIYNEPSAESVEAARQVLSGANTVGDALYFNNTTNCWAGSNRALTSTIGGHYFFS